MEKNKKEQLIANKIKADFFKGLDRKTGWGKNEVKALFISVQNRVYQDILSKNLANLEHLES